MPISDDEWNSGRKRDTYEQRVLDFLKNKGNPCTVAEISIGIGYRYKKVDLIGIIGALAITNNVQNALKSLIREGSVETRIIKQVFTEESYYKAT